MDLNPWLFNHKSGTLTTELSCSPNIKHHWPNSNELLQTKLTGVCSQKPQTSAVSPSSQLESGVKVSGPLISWRTSASSIAGTRWRISFSNTSGNPQSHHPSVSSSFMSKLRPATVNNFIQQYLWKHETIQITHKSPHPSLKRHTCALNNFIQQHFWKHTHTHTKPTSLLILCKNSRLVMVKNFIQQHFWKHTKPSPISLFILRKNSRLVSVAGVGDWIITLEGITARVEKKVERQTKAAFGWGKHPKWSAVLLWKHAFNFSLHYKKQNKNNNNCTYTSMKKLTTTAWL